VGYLDWPGHAQVFQLTRIWWKHGTRHEQVRYGITSLPPAIGTARTGAQTRPLDQRELGPSEQDVNFGEDASLVHVGHGPVCAMLRDAALSLLRATGTTHSAARLRRHSQLPQEAVDLLVHPVTQHKPYIVCPASRRSKKRLAARRCSRSLRSHRRSMTYAICMKRTTIFLTEDLERRLQETARRTRRPQAEIVRDALSQYLHGQTRPWPRSVGSERTPTGR
jgi:hypothetical protein